MLAKMHNNVGDYVEKYCFAVENLLYQIVIVHFVVVSTEKNRSTPFRATYVLI